MDYFCGSIIEAYCTGHQWLAYLNHILLWQGWSNSVHSSCRDRKGTGYTESDTILSWHKIGMNSAMIHQWYKFVDRNFEHLPWQLKKHLPKLCSQNDQAGIQITRQQHTLTLSCHLAAPDQEMTVYSLILTAFDSLAHCSLILWFLDHLDFNNASPMAYEFQL